VPHSAADDLLGHLERLLGAQPYPPVADGELLRRFTAGQDETAFAELVRRHGKLVFGVARRILGNGHDAEDVFQATFLILARKAGSVRRAPALGAWLHGVAARVARKASVSAARRRRREEQAALPVLVAAAEDGPGELYQWLDAEIAALPETLRLPLVLCALQGQTHEQAALRLGWRPSTLKARLHRAREVLRRRLARQGLIASALPELAPAVAPVPDALAGSTVRLAVLFARGPVKECAGAAAALALARGGMELMFWTRMKALLAVLLVVTITGTGAAFLIRTPRPAPDTAPSEGAVARLDLHGDPLPPGARARLGTIRFRLPEDNNFTGPLALTFSPDGKELYTVVDGALGVWESGTGRPIRRLPTGDLHVRGAAFSHDLQLVAVGGFQIVKENEPDVSLIRVLNAATGKEVRRLSHGTEGSDHFSIAFTPDGKNLFSLASSGIVRLEEIATGTELLRQKFRADIMGHLCLSPDGKILAVATGPNTRQVFLWEWQAGKEPREIKVPPRGARSLAFLPDGKTLVTGDDGREGIRLWDVASGRMLLQMGDRNSWGYPPMGRACVSPDGRYIVSSGYRQKGLVLYDAKTGKEVRRMAGIRTGAHSAVFSGDSRRLSALGDGVLRVWDVDTGKEIAADESAPREPPTFVALLAGGAAVTTGDDGVVRVWESATGRHLGKIEVASEWLRAAAVSGDGRWLATSTLGDDHAVGLWDLHTGKRVYRLAGHGRLGGRPALAFTPDGKQLLSWGEDMYLRTWDVRKGKAIEEHEIRPDGQPVPGEDDWNLRKVGGLNRGIFSPDGSFLLIFGRDCFFVFDTKTGKQTTKFASEEGSIGGIAVSPDSKFLLTSGWGKWKEVRLTDGRMRITVDDTLACLYDIAAGKALHRVPCGKDRIGAVAFSSDGKMYAVGLKDRIEFHATATGALRGTIAGVPGAARSLAFSPDGKRIIAGMPDTTALVWDVPIK
jgi:RNA polymerase sigma factor (sigma-70 family)